MNIFLKKRIFLIYNDEEEIAMDSSQLRKFALHQLEKYYDMLTDEEIKDEIESCISKNKKDRIKEIIADFFNPKNRYTEENYVNKITVKDAIELLKLRCFKVREMR